LSSGHDGLLSLPVEFLARDGQLFAHSLENLVLRVIQCVLDDGLVGSLVLVDGGHDDGGVGGLQVHVLILAHKVELDVASLPVVIIDLDDAVQLLVLDVDGPLGLPLARPEVVQLQVDARDVHLQVARLVEAQRGAGSVLLVVLHNILLNKFRNAVPKQINCSCTLTCRSPSPGRSALGSRWCLRGFRPSASGGRS
jgi:hypothetical protein